MDKAPIQKEEKEKVLLHIDSIIVPHLRKVIDHFEQEMDRELEAFNNGKSEAVDKKYMEGRRNALEYAKATIRTVFPPFIKEIQDRTNIDYRELLMAVESKHEGETRHETALRYIREAEQGSNIAEDSRDN